MSVVSENERAKELRAKVDNLLSQTSVIHRDVLAVVNELQLEVNARRSVSDAAVLNAEKMEAEYEKVLDIRRDSIIQLNNQLDWLVGDNLKLENDLRKIRKAFFWCAATAVLSIVGLVVEVVL